MIEDAQPPEDVVADFKPAPRPADHTRIEAMVPMRDGTRLFTLIIVPDGAQSAPIIVDRTPYGARELAEAGQGPLAADKLHALHADLIEAGYVLAIQDVRGKFESEGRYEMNLPPRGAYNTGEADQVTDAWDTVDWLIANVAQGSGRVGALGMSYDGFTALMHLLEPHPALQACVAINPMVDCWMGDDWFHHGAFRQLPAAHYMNRQTTGRGRGAPWPSPAQDEYETWLSAGSAHGMATSLGISELPAWKRLEAHPDYDAYWQSKALDRLLAERDVVVPTLTVHSQWDVEDAYGAPAAFTALRRGASEPGRHHFVTGPWSHACAFFTDGAEHGPLRFASRTAREFRRDVLLPFLDSTLKGGDLGRSDTPAIAQASAYDSGDNRWFAFETWPPPAQTRALYLSDSFALGWSAPANDGPGFDDYLSDPAKPVTHQPRPILRKDAPGYAWGRVSILDQRFAGDRPDVLRYVSPPLEAPLLIAGQPVVHLFASTTGTDADWVVKLIEVYPGEVPGDEAMGGYELPLAIDIFRGRYHRGFAAPAPLPAGEMVAYSFALPTVCRTVSPGRRLMVQIQSSLFPLYDRNPQTFVPNIFHAGPQDYVRANHRVFRQPGAATRIDLPISSPPPRGCGPGGLR